MSTQKFNYQDYLTGYTIPFNYLWALLVMTGDKEFVLELADLVYNSQIEITVFDDYVVSSNSATEKYTVTLPRIKEYTKTTTTRTTNYNTKVDLTRANVWIVDYTNEYIYNKTINGAEWKQKGSQRIDKVDVNSDEPNFETILKKHSDASGFFERYAGSLYKVLENPDNGLTDMLDLTKYLREIYKNGSADAVAEKDRFDFSIFEPGNFKKMSSNTFVGSNLEEKIWFMLKDIGYSDECAAGAMGNFSAETDSGTTINNKCVEAKTDELSTAGEGHGIAQWSKGRKVMLLEYAKSIGKSWEDIDVQLEFLKAELTGGGCNGYATDQRNTVRSEYDAFIASTTPEDAAVHFNGFFELCLTGVEEHDRIGVRKQGARYYYDMFKGREQPTLQTGGNKSIIEAANEIYQYMQNQDYQYCSDICGGVARGYCTHHLTPGIVETNFEASKSGRKVANCTTICLWSYQMAGLWPMTEKSINDHNLLKQRGFQRIYGRENLQPGDILHFTKHNGEEHWELYAGEDKVYNTGNVADMRRGVPAYSNHWPEFDYAYRAPNQ